MEYWTLSVGPACRNGFSCRACRKPIYKDEPMISRDGRKIRLFYHQQCFAGEADPRTQPGSSASEGRLPVSSCAPSSKGYGKWSTGTYGYNPSR
eukprot:GILK01015013.1.p2 GENE.GILK01015013.1~~GILK01015013.1.p2  ORF type:complete len:103 (+),score=4.60 GILK01015013.1:30-311(+)